MQSWLTEPKNTSALIWGATSSFWYAGNNSECKFRVNITYFSLLHPDWCDYSFILIAFKVTFSALYVYSRELASRSAHVALQSPEEGGVGGRQRTFKERTVCCGLSRGPPAATPHYLNQHCFCAGANLQHGEPKGSECSQSTPGSPSEHPTVFPATKPLPSQGQSLYL